MVFTTFNSSNTWVQQWDRTVCSPSDTGGVQRGPHSRQLHVSVSAPRQQQVQTLRVTWRGQHSRARASHTDASDLHTHVHYTSHTPCLAASWMGEASREGALRVAPCCRSTRTQATLPLLQELKRGVAPSVDTASTCGGGTADQLGRSQERSRAWTQISHSIYKYP